MTMRAKRLTRLAVPCALFALTVPGGALQAPLAAQHSPYAGLEEREIKALGTERVAGYLEGHGMSYALAAELNGYPGPKHVLELGSELELGDEQRTATERAFDAMHERAVALGRKIVELERGLDSAFAEGAIEADDLEARTAEIARLEGELRAAHLLAHLRMAEILSPEQRERYVELRGYGGAHSGHHRK